MPQCDNGVSGRPASTVNSRSLQCASSVRPFHLCLCMFRVRPPPTQLALHLPCVHSIHCRHRVNTVRLFRRPIHRPTSPFCNPFGASAFVCCHLQQSSRVNTIRLFPRPILLISFCIPFGASVGVIILCQYSSSLQSSFALPKCTNR